MEQFIYTYASSKRETGLAHAYRKAEPWIWGAGIIAGLYLTAFVALGGLVLLTA